jgi:hypothetical protein
MGANKGKAELSRCICIVADLRALRKQRLPLRQGWNRQGV